MRKKEEEEQGALEFPHSRPLSQLCLVPVKEEVWEMSGKAEMQ